MKPVVLMCGVLAHASDLSHEAVFEQPEKSLCLLNVGQKRYQRLFGDSSELNLEVSNNEFNTLEGISLNISEHTKWLLQFSQSERTMNISLDDLERVADHQEAATQRCKERFKDSKSELKRLVSDASDFSTKVKDHEKKLVDYKQKLSSKEMDITKFETQYRKAVASCLKQRSQAKRDQEHYAKAQGELKRLVVGMANGEGIAALLQIAAAMAIHQTEDGWNTDICQSFLAFLKRNKELSPKASLPPNEDCSTKLESTRKVFFLTTERISELEKAAQARAEDRTCENTAHLKQTASIEPMVGERTTITNQIIESTNSLALMRPVLDRLNTHVGDFDERVKKTIGPECDKGGKVVKSLQTLKDLLASLAKCPGKDGRAVFLAV